MKRKFSGRAVITFCLIIVGVWIYLQYIHNGTSNRDVPLPDSLHPAVSHNAELLIQQSAGKGIEIIITDGFRSHHEQDRLYEKGRSTQGNIVTHAKGGESFHNFGLAIDFAIKANGQAIWDMGYDGNGNGQSDWMEVVEIAKELGFEWGGDWKHFKDYPHLQMDFGLSINDLQKGERPPSQPMTVKSS
ncbi:M15 family metallopeptidase [Mesobacillus foraminis]|uniref:Peptidoglycan L-alanyl-D-glutamate endopeptidase CwlK n=1 Tax=Mesobacillus foraminis TaxID=279826 RepID=A0A4R2BL29_9BACI|nr:M15 family metallopeptidase [Mesobacillus foraminis]TCN27756.1 peptidoglycan L-alanyl-D-glutamate endopeptidase CwlK [Mesobacillus foraminis]